MQIIIDIPEEIRKSIFDGEYCGIIDQRVYDAIKHGTPLPKGHGRLIDVDAIHGDSSWDFADRLDETPTIIEADKVESEGEE